MITNIAAAYPASEFSKMGEGEIHDTARIWADSLQDVPMEAIEELSRRVLRARTSPFPPGLGDYRLAWSGDPKTGEGGWDYWAELNANAEAKTPVLKALPEAPPNMNGLGARTYRAQKEARDQRGAFVCCDCLNEHDIHPPALLSHDGRFWQCAESRPDFPRCAFQWPVSKTKTAPIHKRDNRRQEWLPGHNTKELTPVQVRDLLRLKCEMQVPATGERSDFVTGFGYWLSERHSPEKWTPQLAKEQWAVWQAELSNPQAVEVAA